MKYYSVIKKNEIMSFGFRDRWFGLLRRY
jgi:hypothetical protein